MGLLYHIGGELYLPDPKVCGLDSKHLAVARSLQPLLEILDARDLSKLPKPIDDLDDAFSKFAEKEVNLWAAHSHHMSKELLVKVSGTLQSPLAHRANQPSNTTLCPLNGKVADETNPCIAMIMGNAFQKGHTLIYDQILRRDEKSEGLQKYPEDVLQCHESFVQTVRESSEAKVEIVHGAKVRERIFQSPSFDFDVLPLWGDYKGISIVLDHESNYRNAEPGHKYRRVIVFSVHPQRIFFTNPGESIMQDRSISVAAKIAKINFVEGYYTEQKWRKVVPPNFRDQVKRKYFDIETPNQHSETLTSDNCDFKGSVPLTPYDLAVTKLSTLRKPASIWDIQFSDEAPSSITESRDLVARSLAQVDNNIGSNDWESQADFSTVIQKWLGKQQQAFFKGVPTCHIIDIRILYSRLDATTKASEIEKLSLSDIVLAILKLHLRALERRPHTALDDLIYCDVSPNSMVEVICNQCKETLTTDAQVRWSVNRPNDYVARLRRCNSTVCQGKLRVAIPKNTDIPFAYSSRSDLVGSITRKPQESWQDLTQSQDPQQVLPLMVTSWCIHCKEDTRLKDGRNAYMDMAPRWVLGTPSKYIERRMKCFTCPLNGRSSEPRFVPVNASLPSIYSKTLSRFRLRWGTLKDNVKAELLSCEPESNRKPRHQTRRS